MNSNQIVIAIEGIDGAGKTTIINKLCRQFDGDLIIYERAKKGKIIDKLVSCRLMKKFSMLQIPIYFFLSYKNYIIFKLKKKRKIVIMDRCFLSNICYFYPSAIFDKRLLKKLLFFEIKLFPQAIFILDVDPVLGQKRDNHKKSLKWLEDTRVAYLNTIRSDFLNELHIEILNENISIEEKIEIVTKYIKGREKQW